MTYTQVMTELKKMGTSQNIKIYKNHGAGDNLFGVSFANLKLLQKKIKIDHGQTSCKTPDAKAYIKKSLARLKAKKK